MTNRFSNWIRFAWPTVVVIALASLAQLFLVTRSTTFLVNNILPDDAFFYFKVAHNIVNGLGSTLDGINVTNGYHPLWMLVLLPIFKYFSTGAVGDMAPVHAALLLCVAFNVITAFVVARILSRFSQSIWIRTIGIVAWSFNPFLLYESINGLETSLMLCMFAIFFLFVLRIDERPTPWRFYLAGFFGGFLILSRLDTAFFVIAFFAWIFARQGLHGWRDALRAALPAAVLVFAYVVWNILNFHMLLTASAQTETMVNHVLTAQDNGGGIVQYVKAVMYMTQYEAAIVFQRTGMLSIAFAAIGALVALITLGRVNAPRSLRDITPTIALFGGFVLLFVSNASIRWSGRTWYFVSFDLFLAILIVFVLDRVLTTISWKRTAAFVFLLIMLFSFYVDWSKFLAPSKNPLDGQADLIAAAQWMSAALPPSSRVGTFTPGIQSYFASVPVVDLDGLINNSAYDALKERDLWKYVENENITYISGTGDNITYRYKSFWGIDDPLDHLTLVESIDAGAVDIYQVH